MLRTSLLISSEALFALILHAYACRIFGLLDAASVGSMGKHAAGRAFGSKQCCLMRGNQWGFNQSNG